MQPPGGTKAWYITNLPGVVFISLNRYTGCRDPLDPSIIRTKQLVHKVYAPYVLTGKDLQSADEQQKKTRVGAGCGGPAPRLQSGKGALYSTSAEADFWSILFGQRAKAGTDLRRMV